MSEKTDKSENSDNVNQLIDGCKKLSVNDKEKDKVSIRVGGLQGRLP